MAASLTEEELTELERLNEEAMAPPWVVDRIDDDSCCALDVITIDPKVLEEEGVESDNPPILAYLSHPDHTEGLACSEAEKLICATRNALPALLASARAVRRIEALADELHQAAERAAASEDERDDTKNYLIAERLIREALTAAAEPNAGEKR